MPAVIKNIGIVGLGLIGGSLAKALSVKTHYNIIGFDNDKHVLDTACTEGIVSIADINECDIIIIALYPQAAVDFITENAEKIKKGALVIDCCGVKEGVCGKISIIAKENGFKFIGGHPMAGTEKKGYTASFAALFDNAYMILCPCGLTDKNDEVLLEDLFKSIGFKEITVCSPAHHDNVISYTSQLAHVLSSAYLKSGKSIDAKGFSAGSFKDLTRVGGMNERLWSELFIENGEALCNSIDCFIAEILEYRNAIIEKDLKKLMDIIVKGNLLKEQLK